MDMAIVHLQPNALLQEPDAAARADQQAQWLRVLARSQARAVSKPGMRWFGTMVWRARLAEVMWVFVSTTVAHKLWARAQNTEFMLAEAVRHPSAPKRRRTDQL